MQINLPEDTVEKCRSQMYPKETWAGFIERLLIENTTMKERLIRENKEMSECLSKKSQ